MATLKYFSCYSLFIHISLSLSLSLSLDCFNPCFSKPLTLSPTDVRLPLSYAQPLPLLVHPMHHRTRKRRRSASAASTPYATHTVLLTMTGPCVVRPDLYASIRNSEAPAMALDSLLVYRRITVDPCQILRNRNSTTSSFWPSPKSKIHPTQNSNNISALICIIASNSSHHIHTLSPFWIVYIENKITHR
ncbi:hypothetical protein BX666DRAFT_1477067 [Dichotomocladium elegans]|nr:hypothetical protein BX666DRAFT_1477067 [Dichotomocladium elegans]